MAVGRLCLIYKQFEYLQANHNPLEQDIHHNNVAVVFVDSPVTEDILFEQGKVAPVCHTNGTCFLFVGSPLFKLAFFKPIMLIETRKIDASHLNDNCWALGVTTGPQAAGAKPRVSSSVQLDVERQSLKYCIDQLILLNEGTC